MVADVDGHSVELVERHTVVDGKWYIAYDEESETALARSGKRARPEATRIARHNIRRVFTAEETRSWRTANLQHHTRDVAVLIDAAVDIGYVCGVLARIHPAVVSGSVEDPRGAAWLLRYGMQNKVLRFTIFGDRDPEACVAEIVRSLRLLGIRTGADKATTDR